LGCPVRRFGEVDEAREAMKKFEQRRQLDTKSVVKFEEVFRTLYRVAWLKPLLNKKRQASKPGSRKDY